MNELEQRIHAFLLVSPNSNAKLIARAIGEDVSTVNRCLYENSKKGTFFKSVGDTPPHWNCLEPDADSSSINMQVDGQDTFNMTNLHFFENRIKTIRTYFRHSNTGYKNRGQISPDASVDDVATYAPLGVAHANELQQTLEDLKKFISSELHVLEIGCGWGGVMEESLRSNIAITGLTLSTEQKAYAEDRLTKIKSQINNPQSFEVRLQDYRDCQR